MISIVTAYYNRRRLFYRTLKKLEQSTFIDFEFIAVDDNSNDENRIEDLSIEFPFLKVIRIEARNKWYKNPCIPFNIGISHAKGDKIILQNPECIHVGNILKYVEQHLQINEYATFSCYSLNKEETLSLDDNLLSDDYLLNLIKTKDRSAQFDGDNGWYNHPEYRPSAYHFCAAIHKDELQDLGGFDERYAKGIAFDDDELLYRIRLKGMIVSIIPFPFVLHQDHYVAPVLPIDPVKELNYKQLWNRNKGLWNEVTRKDNNFRVNRFFRTSLRNHLLYVRYQLAMFKRNHSKKSERI